MFVLFFCAARPRFRHRRGFNSFQQFVYCCCCFIFLTLLLCVLVSCCRDAHVAAVRSRRGKRVDSQISAIMLIASIGLSSCKPPIRPYALLCSSRPLLKVTQCSHRRNLHVEAQCNACNILSCKLIIIRGNFTSFGPNFILFLVVFFFCRYLFFCL